MVLLLLFKQLALVVGAAVIGRRAAAAVIAAAAADAAQVAAGVSVHFTDPRHLPNQTHGLEAFPPLQRNNK